MISALIIDDEEHNRSVLKHLLSKNCPEIKVMAESDGADDAYQKINALKPKLIFLDIRMPEKSGFDLLKMFSKIDFEVVFVTAHDTYAIRAFEFNVVGYLLKPINTAKLIAAVDKVSQKIQSSTAGESILHFVKTLSDENELMNKFFLHHGGKVVFVKVADITFIETKDNNTTLNLHDKSHYYSSKDLVTYEQALEASGNFMRINKSVIVNINFIRSYTKTEPCIIEIKTGQSFEVSRRRKSDILKKLKSL